jgi:natural product biosynthesis luciferase-like monooxygenase protein
MLFHHVHGGREQGVDIEQLEGWLHEAIDPEAFGLAWGTVLQRHSILRTRFRWEGLDVPVQEVLEHVETPFEYHDLTASSRAEQEARLATFLADDRRRGFDLSEAPLWRIHLFRLSPSEHRMVWTYSHAILDSCYAAVLREAFLAYEARLEGRQVSFEDRPTYRAHIEWLDKHLAAKRDEASRFWRDRLAGFATPTRIEAAGGPSGLTGPAGTSAGHDTVRFKVPRASSEAIRRIAQDNGLRVSGFVEGAWGLVLSAFSGEEDVVFGSTRACRGSSIPGADSIVGLFINTLPVRAKVEPDLPVLDLLHRLRADQVAVRPFEHTPLVDVLASADVGRGAALFETIIVFNDRDNDARLKSFGAGWERRDFELHDQTNFPLNVMAYDEPEITFKLSYDRGRFTRATMERIASLLESLLVAMGERPDAPLRDLPRLPEQDARAVLGTFNATDARFQGPSCIHEAFEAQVDRTPNATAIVFRDRSLTYRELDERANRVAEELASRGIGADSMVGVFVERSLEMVIGLFGILKAGAAYVPMDPAYPRERVAIMLEDTAAPVVLTLERLKAELPETRAAVIALDAFGGERRTKRLAGRATATNLAYVIFTSGSTGRPKGVQIEHRNVANFFGAMDRALGTTPGTWLALTSISFDISVLEIFWTLARGFKVVVQEEANASSTRRAATGVASTTSKPRTRAIGFSLFYFAADAAESTGGKYRLLLEGAKFADTHGFEAVWTPERHFHPFGGLYPNPSLTGAAVAVVTERVGIRAGSVVLPLHNPIRCAEEWSVVDNLSNGRVGLSFASGWHPGDFALAPANYKERRELMARGIETVRALWAGAKVPVTGGDGKTIEVKVYPPPVQREPPMWITASGSPETFAMAGRMGANILTNLLVMKPEEFVANAAVYRKAYREAGHPGQGHITLMLHTFVGHDATEVRAKVRGPFLEYLKTSTDLINKARWELTAFAKGDDRKPAAPGTSMNLDDLSREDMDALLDHAFERYYASAGLFGTPETCLAAVDRLREMGVDEIACLIDFGVDTETVLANLASLDELKRMSNTGVVDGDGAAADYAIAAQIRRHAVTHMQCTPSLAGMLASDDETLGSLAALRSLLVGGEALAPALVERIRSSYRGTIHNMYGPTETTVWSTTAAIEGTPGEITIGRPIANTRVYVVDRHLRPMPIGVPGEIVIGGDGVVRGYLARPDLTKERFVRDPFGSDGGRLYRTGDLGRWLPGGELEFLGRNDHQVKIRGYRIELGEIEFVLRSHPAVRDAVVVARPDVAGSASLVAYMVPRKDGGADASKGRAKDSVSSWETVWEETYRQPRAADGTFNTAGWRSSYTGEEIPEDEMRHWLEVTTRRVLEAARETSPKPRVLEIGCGTGMILFRVAPHCAQYVGVDVSPTALALVEAQRAARQLDNVRLERLAADGIGALADAGPFDVIILNSVVQYFPDAGYLGRVLEAAYALLAPGGGIFVGDVRPLAQLEAFHASIELARAADSLTTAELRARVARRAAEEHELVVDPQFFDGLCPALAGQSASLRIDLKEGRSGNEMTRYRYDALIRKAGGRVAGDAAVQRTVDATEPCTLESLRSLLRDEPVSLCVRGLVNARVAADVAASRHLRSSDGTEADVGSLRRALGAVPLSALDPDDVRGVHPEYAATIAPSPGRADRMDVTFRHRAKHEDGKASTTLSARLPALAMRAVKTPLESFTNHPVARPAHEGFSLAALRSLVRDRLPDFMVPTAFVALEALPLTPNGKIDRAALPAPDHARPESGAPRDPPRNDIERGIVSVLRELTGMGDVGAEDNFFDVGANSLILVQASVRLRAVLGRQVPLVKLFQFPSARALATAIGESEASTAGGTAAQKKEESQERAQTRRDALQAMQLRRAAAAETARTRR